MSIAEIEKMTVQEKLTAMEQIWESLSQKETNLESPDWHEDVLRDRKAKIDSGAGEFLTIEQLREKYR